MTRVHKVTAFLVVALGVVHIAMAPVFFEELAERVMWYIAQGLFGIALGFLNIVISRGARQDRKAALLSHTANALGVVFIGLYTTVDSSPPSYVALALFIALFGSAILSDRRSAYLLSDDNASTAQRTLLLAFDWRPGL